MNYVNAAFECIAAIFGWISVFKLLKEQRVQGVFGPAFVLSAVWACTAVFYYVNHADTASALFCSIRALAYVVWCCLWGHYSTQPTVRVPLRVVRGGKSGTKTGS